MLISKITNYRACIYGRSVSQWEKLSVSVDLLYEAFYYPQVTAFGEPVMMIMSIASEALGCCPVASYVITPAY